ncbi:MAG: pilus assembly protein TadG-related protein [Acidimicrobiia bacterium]
MITAFVTGVTAALLLAGALVYDGGQLLVARRHAVNVAASAARFGAQEVDVDALYRGEGVHLNSDRAEAAAIEAALADGASSATANATADSVEVRVVFPDQSVLAGVAGAGGVASIKGAASARVARGTDQG